MKYLTFLFVMIVQPIQAQVNDPEILINSDQEERNETEKWADISIELTDSVSLDALDIFIPHALTVNGNGIISLMAWGERKVFLFNEGDLNNPKTLSTRKGRGPREYEDPFDMYLSDKYLVISDIGLRKVDLWDIESQSIYNSFSINNKLIKPDQVAYCIEDDIEIIYALSSQYGFGNKREDEGFMHKFVNIEDEFVLEKTFQKLSDENEMYAYSITGDINCSKNGGIIYSADFAGSIRKYDRNGKLIFFRNTANFVVTEPLFLQPNENQTWANPKAPRINGELFELNDDIYVARSRDLNRDIHGFDVYSAENAMYRFSFPLVNRAEDVAITNNKIYTIEYRGEDGFDLKVYDYKLDK